VEGSELVVGRCRYRTVIVPSHSTLRRSTLELLRAFKQNGGRVLAVAPTPTLLEGVPDAEVTEFFAGVPTVAANADELSRVLPLSVSIANADGAQISSILYQHRRVGDLNLFFLANTSYTTGHEAVVRLPARGVAEEWDPATGQVSLLPQRPVTQGTELALTFAPVGSRLVVVRPGVSVPVEAPVAREVERRTLNDWRISRTDYNALVLDMVRFRIGDGEWRGPFYIQRAWEEVRRHYGLEPDHNGRRMQMWRILERMKPLPGNPQVAVEYRFELGFRPAGQALILVVETPERFQIAVNGQLVPAGDAGFWRDQAFRKVDIAPLARPGTNLITLTCPQFAEDVELETAYLIGDFAVSRQGAGFVLTPETDLPFGDWTTQGYPFYAGSFVYGTEVELRALEADERVLVEVPEWKGAVLRVSANGGDPVVVGWPPYRADVTAWVKPGANQIRVEVVNTLRNLLGPHHQAVPTPGLTAPGSFYQPNNWSDDYYLFPYGLIGPVHLVRERVKG
jgi:hypothetical protein